MDDDQTTVSWKMIEHGWAVYSSDGERIGQVYLIDGDENADVFDGLAITHHGGPEIMHTYGDHPHYVRADQVASIQPEAVHLSIPAEDVRGLPEHHAPESLDILPDSAGHIDRAETYLQEHLGGDKES